MPEERKTIEARSSASPEVYQHTKFMARFEKAFPWLLVGGTALVLLETYRKNANDRAKANADIKAALKNQEHQAEVLKERKAERRERYTKAVEQLGNEKALVRMGGMYTLIGLVDEWLLDENLDYTEKVREGQVIVNNLCAYIRSPFILASYYDELSEDKPSSEGIYKDNQQKFYTDKAAFKAEADIRLSIIKEIHNRLQSPDKNTPGAWSDFEYDFSGSTFFYPVDLTNSYYKKPVNFSGATYKGWADFSHSTYEGRAYFSHSTYKGGASFGGSTYKGEAYFNYSTYKGEAYFNYSTYKGEANFTGSTYKGGAYFNCSIYKGWANFNYSTYKGGALFSYSIYKGGANFNYSIYKGGANFTGSTYKGEAYFNCSIYKGGANFTGSTYKGGANFTGSTYKGEADFSGSVFYREIYFGYSTYSPSFSRFTNYAPQFYDETNHKNTLFGSPDNDFTVENGRGYPIYRSLDGLPLGCSFLTSEQKEYLTDKFQEIDETKNKLLEIKDPKEKEELLKKLRSLNKELHDWREKATTVKVEGTALGEDDN